MNREKHRKVETYGVREVRSERGSERYRERERVREAGRERERGEGAGF